jgi:hypothetical protein
MGWKDAMDERSETTEAVSKTTTNDGDGPDEQISEGE